MNDNATEHARQARLIHDAIARGQAAQGAGDQGEAHPLAGPCASAGAHRCDHHVAPASALIGDDNAKSADLFSQVLDSHDVRDAWLGLATTRYLLGDLAAVGAALAEVLSRHALWPGDRRAGGWNGAGDRRGGLVWPDRRRRTGCASGWRPADRDTGRRQTASGDRPGQAEAAVLMAAHALDNRCDLEGARAIVILLAAPSRPRRSDGSKAMWKSWRRGIRGWAWHPGDPDTDPLLSIEMGRARRDIVASAPADGIPGLVPLARPRSFDVLWVDLPPPDAPRASARAGWS